MALKGEAQATQAADVQADEALLAEVRELVNAFAKTLKILRTYPRENSISVNAIDELTKRFDEHLGRHGTLELLVNRHELQWQGIPVYADGDQRTAFTSRLDRDGVRQLVFETGIDRAEIVMLLEALTTEIDEDSLDDDLVTLLWEKQFSHVKFCVVDKASTGQGGFSPELVLADAPHGVSAEGTGGDDSSTPTGAASAEKDACPGPIPPSLCAEIRTRLNATSDEELRVLETMVREEASRDVCGELADILIDVLQSMTQCEAQTSALRVLNEFASMYVRQASFGQAAHILGRLRALAANESVDVDLRAHAAEQLLALGDRSCTEAVAEALKEHENVDKAELARFFTMLPASAAPELCELMQIERYNDTVCSAVRHLVTDNPQLLTAKLAVSNVEVAKKVLGILDGMAVPELGRALVDPLTAAEDAVKMASIRLLSRIGGPAARGILLTYAEGADAALRRSALKALAAFGGPPVPTPVLRRRVLARDFDDRTLEEKKTLLVALAKLESVLAISFLEEVLSRKKWFEKPGHAETRACAAFALGEMGDDGARAILKRFVSDRAEVVRTAAGLALRRGAATTACTGA